MSNIAGHSTYMPELINERKIFSLLEVSASIRNTLQQRYTSAFWVKAEMNKLNYYPQSGHCYPDLVEKQDEKVVAQLKANLWKDEYIRINRQFLQTINEPLRDGIKILLLAKISFDAVHGLTLKVLDIDPSYTLGDLEKERRETIEKLQQEGVYLNNKKLTLPLLPQRIAIISDETSKGYADFKNVIDKNPWNYKIFYMLFPSLLQGDKSVGAIIQQLKRIKRVVQHFDAVAIIRGGGGDIGLSSFNHYQLCKEIALFPIPVLTGIGHSTNETVTEMVAHSNQITPTKLAEYIIQKFHNYSVPVQKAQEKIVEQSKRIMKEANKDLAMQQRMLIQQANNILRVAHADLSTNRSKLKNESERAITASYQSLKVNVNMMKKDVNAQIRSFNRTHELHIFSMITATKRFFNNMHVSIINAERNVSNMSPDNVLKRGYSITLHGGKAIKDTDEIKVGDTVDTVLFKGKLTSTIKAKNNG